MLPPFSRHSRDRKAATPSASSRMPTPPCGTCRRSCWKVSIVFRESRRRSTIICSAKTELPDEAEALSRRLERFIGILDEIFHLDTPQNVCWFERRGRGVFLHLTPIDMAPILQEKLFDRTETAILTSATLTTDRHFDYLKERLGIPEPREVILSGEFNFSRQAILYIPRSLPQPRSPSYFLRAVSEMERILEITDGHAFLLFTSFHQMNSVYRALLERVPYPLFRQGDVPKNQLLETFKQTPRAVLCATSSFWQGVDVQGDALRAVVIDKLPFLVPSEPVVAARIHRLESQGENSFLKYSVSGSHHYITTGPGKADSLAAGPRNPGHFRQPPPHPKLWPTVSKELAKLPA